MAKETIGLDLDIRLQNAKSLTDLKQVLKDARDAAVGMKAGTAEYQKFMKTAAEAKERIKDINEELMAMDTGDKAKAFQQLGNTIVGGFQAGVGALAVFTGDNEKLNQVLVRSMALVQGLQGIQAIADSKRSIEIIKNILGINKQTTSIVAQTTAVKAQEAATTKLTVIQRIFNLVMKANPIMMIVTAVTLLIGGLVLLYNKVDFVRKAFDALFAPIKQILVYLGLMKSDEEKLSEALKEHTDAVEKWAEAEQVRIRIMKANHATAKEIYLAERNLIIQRANAIAQEIILMKKRNDLSDDERKHLDELRVSYGNFIADLKEKDNEYADSLKKKEEDDKKKREEDKKLRDEQRKKAQDDAKSRLDDAREEESKKREEEDKLLEEEDKRREESLDKLHDYNEKVSASKLEAIKQQQDDAREDQKIQEELDKAKMQSHVAALNSVLDAASTLGDLFIKDQKKRAILQLAIDEARAIAAAVQGAAEASIFAGPAQPVAIISYIASNLAAIATPIIAARNALKQAGASGGGSSITASSPSAPSFTPTDTTTKLRSQRNEPPKETESFRAYVVQSDLSKSQRTADKIKKLSVH